MCHFVPLLNHAKLKPSAKADSQLLIMADVQTAEKLASTKLAPTEINGSRSGLLFEHHSRKKDETAYPIRLGLEDHLKPQGPSRTTVRSRKRSHSQGCSPPRESGPQVICVSTPNISKVMSPKLSISASKKGLRDPCGPRGMNSCVHTSSSSPPRSAASLNGLSGMHDHLSCSAPSPKHKFRKGTPTDPSRHHLERTGMPCKVYHNLLSPGQLPHTQMYQERGRNVKQFPLPSFHHYSAHSYFHLNILTSLFSSYHLSSSLNWLACPLYSELIQGRQGFRSHGIPGGTSLQISRGKFSRLCNSPVLLGQAPSVKKS